jgi:hypothetical protein
MTTQHGSNMAAAQNRVQTLLGTSQQKRQVVIEARLWTVVTSNPCLDMVTEKIIGK